MPSLALGTLSATPVPRRIEGQRTSGYALRRALAAGIQRVIARRDEINRINVFPVPDGDTGTNLAFTLGSMLGVVRERRSSHAGEVLRRVASEAIDGARGNSGAILAQFFQGVAERLSGSARLTPAALAAAAVDGSRLAREALADPREGTILSVIQAFAAEWGRAVDGGARDFRSSFERALARAQQALRDTPLQLAVLRNAGVVDAGAMGFVDLLEGIGDYIRAGHAVADADADADTSGGLAVAGVDAVPNALHGGAEVHGYCTECVVSADPVDRGGLKVALLALKLDSLVLAGTREKVRVHAHTDTPAQLFEACGRFGRLSSQKADNMHLQAESAAQSRERVAIVVDSGADIPAEEMERLSIHMVPVRISLGARDFLDKVSLSAREFYAELRDGPVPPRTSQPPPGDFRRMFEFLLSHHAELVYVGLSRALSGTLQSAESAATRIASGATHIVDSRIGSAAQGLLAMDAAAAAAAGWSAERIVARVQHMIPRTHFYAVVRDLSYGVRGGRAPALALPLSRLLRMLPIIRGTSKGRLGMGGALWGRERLAERFAAAVARRLDRGKRWRVLVGHCDCAEDGARLRAALRAKLPSIEQDWLIEAGVAIGAHAGPGSLVVGLQEVVPLADEVGA
jgi:DegV family protein with EDD domain